ncbi:MAG: carbohydrate kinase family protein [Roseateles asaccharophilus]|uniref:Fructokinase n=1 Tax=Roseateles asaccharophilus TaxID=582607 RepID=A0A4V3CJ21_9BURK|nr:carbohydrate kinase [Roseateles asaccharophilus]MDN3545398.1 carbohydrate kinase [Roseateles asaccharophilus]TDP07778.1 fructokinase [Roseateles asaccharophilus]
MSAQLHPACDAALPRFIAFGEALTDMVRCGDGDQWRSSCGGAPWNVARAVARLGMTSAFAGAVSADVLGQALWSASAEAGLDLRFLQQLERPPLLALVYQTDPPRYFFVGENSADLHFDARHLPTGWPQAAQWALFGGISLARPPLAEQLLQQAQAFKAAGGRIAYDPNFRVAMDARYDAMLERMCRLADVIKVSDEDLCGLFRCADPRAGLARLRAWNPEALVLLTLGAAGAELHLGAQTLRARAPRIEVVDTVGAGDASMAALLYSLMQAPQAGAEQHLRSAVAGGTLACLGAGACPPTAGQLQDWLGRIELS